MSKSKEVTPVQAAVHTLQKMELQLSASLPKHMSTEKFMRVASMAIQNPAIATKLNKGSVDRPSLFSSCTKAAQDGLLLDGREATLVTFYDKTSKADIVQYMPMINGVMKKVRNSGEVSTIRADVVYENDSFEYWVDEDGQHILHKPLLVGERGKLTIAYAAAVLKDGSRMIEVMTRDDISRVREVSRSKDSGPWKSWESEMWKKTVLRRLCKVLPSSADLDHLWDNDNELYDLSAKSAEPQDAAKPGQKKAGTRASQVIAGKFPDPAEAEDATIIDGNDVNPVDDSGEDDPI